MRIHISSCQHRTMPQPVLHLYERHMGRYQEAGAAMPLWHNKDKSEKPCGGTG